MRFADIRAASKTAGSVELVQAKRSAPNVRFWFLSQFSRSRAFLRKTKNRQLFGPLCREDVIVKRVGPGVGHVAVDFGGASQVCLVCKERGPYHFLGIGSLCKEHEKQTRDLVSIPVPMQY